MNAPIQWSNLDAGRAERLQRAVSSSSAGSVLLDATIDPIVQMLTLRRLGVWSTLRHEPAEGDKHYVNQRTPGTTGGAWVADTDSGTEETGTYAQATFEYKTALTKGRVTRKLQRTARSYGDALGIEIGGKAEDFAEFLEDGMLHGDSDASANQPDGLITLINAQSTQVVAVTSAAAGDDLTASHLDQAIDLIKGREDRSKIRIYANASGKRKINALLASNQQFNDKIEIAGGFRVRSYDDAPIIESTELRSTYTWGGSSVTAFSGASTEIILLVHDDYVQIDDLSPVTTVPLAKTSSQQDDFEMYWDGAPVLLNTKGAALIGGIAAS